MGTPALIYPFNFCRVSSNVLSFNPDIGNLCLLFFFLVGLTKDLSLLLDFSKNCLSVSLIFLYYFYFIDIHSDFIISLLLLSLGLSCSFLIS